MWGFLNCFKSYTHHLAELSVRFTDKLMLMKTKPNCVNWTHDDDIAFAQLKTARVIVSEGTYVQQNGGTMRNL